MNTNQLYIMNATSKSKNNSINSANFSTIDDLLNQAWQVRDLDSGRSAQILSDIFAFLGSYNEESAEVDRWHACAQIIHCFLLRRQLDFSESLIYGHSAAATLEKVQDQLWLGRVYGNIGTSYLHLGMRGEAIQFLLKQLEIGITIGDEELKSASNHNLGSAHMGTGNYAEAASYFQKSFKNQSACDNIVLYTYTVTNLAHCWIHLGKYDQARKELADCLNLTQKAQEHHAESVVWRLMGELAEALERDHSALTYYNKAQALNQMHGNQYTGILISMAQGRVHLRRGCTSMALSGLRAALSKSTQIGERALIYQAHELLSDAFSQLNDTAQALYHYKEFHQIKEDVFNVQSEQKIQVLKLIHENKFGSNAESGIANQVLLQNDVHSSVQESIPEPLSSSLSVDFHELRAELSVIYLYCSQLSSLNYDLSSQQKSNANQNIKKSLATASELLTKIQHECEAHGSTSNS